MNDLDLSIMMAAKTPLEAAQAALALSLIPVPVTKGDRIPTVLWGSEEYAPVVSELPRLFLPERNIALIGGTRSASLVDIDVDSPWADPFVSLLFPDCPSFGRPSRRRSHIQVLCPEAETTKLSAPKEASDDAAWKLGNHGSCIVEIQADRKLITISPSIHPSGEPYGWEAGPTVARQWSASDLKRAVGTLAVMACFSAYYPGAGRRHDACLATSGMLVRMGWAGEFSDELVQTAARHNGDEEWQKRGGGRSAQDRLGRGEPVAGVPAFMSAVGFASYWGPRFRAWLFPDHPDELVIDGGAPRETARELIKRGYETAEGRNLAYYQGNLHRYDNGGWRPVGEVEDRSIVYEFMEGGIERLKGGKTRSFRPTPGHVSSVLDALKPLVAIPPKSPPFWLDGRSAPPPDQVLVFANGHVDAVSQALTPATPQLFSLNQIHRPYDASAAPPESFLTWLDQVWPGCSTTAELIQEMMGVCLTSDTSFQKIFMLYGPPRAGKGVLTTVMQAHVGVTNYTSPTLASLGDGFGMQPLLGKLVAFIPDARLDMMVYRNGVTQSLLAVSGEDSQSIQRKFKSAQEGKLTARFVITTNEIPQLRDDAGALTARFVPLVFEQSFQGREDHNLKARLLNELPSITRWALEGYGRLKKRGHFILPSASLDLQSRMTVVFSHLGSFIEDCLVEDPGAVTLSSLLFDTYRAWAESQGQRNILHSAQFGERLNQRGYPMIQRRSDNKRRARVGLRLNDEWKNRMAPPGAF